MKASTRFTIVVASMVLCVVGVFIARSGSNGTGSCGSGFQSTETIVASDDYQFAASRTPKLTFQQLETIIRRDSVAKSQRGKIEFGSVKIEQETALAEVMFVSDDGKVLPFLYKLLPERNSWKIVNVQRIWYVPRSHLLRGVRA